MKSLASLMAATDILPVLRASLPVARLRLGGRNHVWRDAMRYNPADPGPRWLGAMSGHFFGGWWIIWQGAGSPRTGGE